EERHEATGEARTPGRSREDSGSLMQVRAHVGDRRAGTKGKHTGENMVSHHSERIEIASPIDRFALPEQADLLRRAVLQLAKEVAGLRQLRRARDFLGDPEVDDLRGRMASPEHDQDVVWREVAVHDATGRDLA